MSILRGIALILGSGLGTGYVKFAPGTFGSLLGIPIYFGFLKICTMFYPAEKIGQVIVYLLLCSLLFLLGVWAAGVGEQHWKESDPGKVVIDEVVGFLITMTALPARPLWLITGFVVFRILDIVKIWPSSYADKVLTGGLGIMLDDFFSGIQAMLLLQILRLFLKM